MEEIKIKTNRGYDYIPTLDEQLEQFKNFEQSPESCKELLNDILQIMDGEINESN